jgi:hypothetical protein
VLEMSVLSSPQQTSQVITLPYALMYVFYCCLTRISTRNIRSGIIRPQMIMFICTQNSLIFAGFSRCDLCVFFHSFDDLFSVLNKISSGVKVVSFFLMLFDFRYATVFKYFDEISKLDLFVR